MGIHYRDINDPLAALLKGGAPVLVAGLGASGLSAANLLAKMGCRVEISEKKQPENSSVDLSQLNPSVTVHWGGHPTDLFIRFPLIIVSPGVPRNLGVLKAAREGGAKVLGEMELAYRLTRAPWVAVTGSNGKSTTVTLLDLMAREWGMNVRTGGNLGTPVTGFVDVEDSPEFIIVEVSSFQLETTENFQPVIAALLNISPDHLDRHVDLEEYVGTKLKLFSKMDKDEWIILNDDDPRITRETRHLRQKRFPFSRKHRLAKGVFVKEGMITVREGEAECPVTTSKSLVLRGTHNLENALAATAMAHTMGIGPEAIAGVLRSFTGLEHRMELVGYFRGVPVYNDSKGTNVGATVRSLQGLGGDVILILGGKDKGAPYGPLEKIIRKKVSHLVLLGEAAGRMREEFNGAAEIVVVKDLDEAVRVAIQRARSGSEILFSPACSSFDMFSGYEERGRIFKEAARKYMRLM